MGIKGQSIMNQRYGKLGEGGFWELCVQLSYVPITMSSCVHVLQEQLLAEIERMQMEIDQLRGRPVSTYSR